MKENSIKNERSSIEEYVKILEKFSNENVIYGSTVGMTLEKYKDLQLSAEHILSDYKRVLKENEELKEKNKILEELLQGNLYNLYKYYRELAGSYQGNCIPVQKIKDKIEELNKQLEEDLQDEIKVNSNRFIIICQCKSCLQELLGSEE